jgi:hypothetical protein
MNYIGRKLFARHGTKDAKLAGVITAISPCRMEGCRGQRLQVRWPDGTRTCPCSKGCEVQPDGSLRIL